MPADRRTFGVWSYFGERDTVLTTQASGLNRARILDRFWLMHFGVVDREYSAGLWALAATGHRRRGMLRRGQITAQTYPGFRSLEAS